MRRPSQPQSSRGPSPPQLFAVPTEPRPFFRVRSAAPQRQRSDASQASPCPLDPSLARRPPTARSDLRRTWIMHRPYTVHSASRSRPSATIALGSPIVDHSSSRKLKVDRSDITSASLVELDRFDQRLGHQSAVESTEESFTASLPLKSPDALHIDQKKMTAAVVDNAAYNRDYVLTRSLFHRRTLETLSVMRKLSALSPAEMRERLSALRSLFGDDIKLGHRDFHTWLGSLVDAPVSRAESDRLFNAFDESHRGAISEKSFVMGLQSVFGGTHRTVITTLKLLIGDERSTAGSVMSVAEAETLLDGIVSVAEHRYPTIPAAVATVKRSLAGVAQQAQLPASEFRRALEMSPPISKLLHELQDNGGLPPSPAPPPTPDPDRDVAALSKGKPHPLARRRATKEGVPPIDRSIIVDEPMARGPPVYASPTFKSGKLDAAHPAFRADECLAAERNTDEMPESCAAQWFIRNGLVWCRTAQGEFPIDPDSR